MFADPLTKTMNAEQLVRTMMTGKFDMRPTAESLKFGGDLSKSTESKRSYKNNYRLASEAGYSHSDSHF